MARFPAQLFWIASYPKSGNTWMRILLSNLTAPEGKPVDINLLQEEESLLGRWRFGDDVLVDADLLDWRELELLRQMQCKHAVTELQRAFFCKTHDNFVGRTGKPVLGDAARAAMYLVRDPRDVVISLSHHLGLSIDDTLTIMTNPSCNAAAGLQLPYLIGDWAAHVAGWADNPLVDTLVVRYEDLRRDTVQVLTRVVHFFSGEASADEINRAVEHSSLEQLQQQERTRGFREKLPHQKQFFRSGRVGEWQQELNASQLRKIEDHFAETMVRFGYPLAS